MATEHKTDASLKNMRNAAQSLSEMLAHTVSELRRLQKQEERALGHRFETREELGKSYDTKGMKELTAILKDVAAVEKALSETSAEQEVAATTGVVLLPPVLSLLDDALEELPEENPLEYTDGRSSGEVAAEATSKRKTAQDVTSTGRR